MLHLISTDFDGTLIGLSPNESCVESLALALEEIERAGVIWCINTGRPFFYLLEGLKNLNAPIAPHFIMTNERHLYYRNNEKWIPLGDWNRQCDILHASLFRKSAHFFDSLRNLVSQYQGVTILSDHEGTPEGLVTESEELLDEVVLRIIELPTRPKDIFFQRSQIYLRFCHPSYDKGATLNELTRHLGVKPDHVLAVGDHYNDLAMLTGEVAHMTACPSNAHDLVKQAVIKTGGHISELPAGEGTAEAIHHYHFSKNQKREKV